MSTHHFPASNQPNDRTEPPPRDSEALEERLIERQVGREFGPGGPPLDRAQPRASEVVVVQITHGRFDGEWYRQTTGQARLLVKTRGGPHLFSIDMLLDATELPPEGTTEIPVLLSEPGQHTMRVQSATGGTSTAILDIHD